MSQNPQAALLNLIDSYLADLKQEAETVTTIAKLLNNSIEGRQTLMRELEAFFWARQSTQPPVPQEQMQQMQQRADSLIRDFDRMVGHTEAGVKAQSNAQQDLPGATAGGL